MGTLRLRYVSYLLRLWQVQEQEQLAWRASIAGCQHRGTLWVL
jgi:hypothetical protein